MSDETKKERLLSEALQRLAAFYQLLLQIDLKNQITATAKKQTKKGGNYEA